MDRDETEPGNADSSAPTDPVESGPPTSHRESLERRHPPAGHRWIRIVSPIASLEPEPPVRRGESGLPGPEAEPPARRGQSGLPRPEAELPVWRGLSGLPESEPERPVEHAQPRLPEPASERLDLPPEHQAEPPGWPGSVLAELIPQPGALGDYLEHLPPGERLAKVLAAIDPADVDDFSLVEVVAAHKRMEAWSAHQAARAAAVLAERDSVNPTWPGDVPGRTRGECVVGQELSMRLRIGKQTAVTMVACGRAFSGMFEPTGDLLQQGLIDYPRARAIVTRLQDLPAEVALAAQWQVLDKAPGRTLRQLGEDLDKAVIAVDPDSADDRHRTARQKRCVNHPRPLPDGMALLSACLPAADAIATYLAVDGAARAAKNTGDSRTLDQLRADSLALMSHTALTLGHIGPGTHIQCTCGCQEPGKQPETTPLTTLQDVPPPAPDTTSLPPIAPHEESAPTQGATPLPPTAPQTESAPAETESPLLPTAPQPQPASSTTSAPPMAEPDRASVSGTTTAPPIAEPDPAPISRTPSVPPVAREPEPAALPSPTDMPPPVAQLGALVPGTAPPPSQRAPSPGAELPPDVSPPFASPPPTPAAPGPQTNEHPQSNADARPSGPSSPPSPQVMEPPPPPPTLASDASVAATRFADGPPLPGHRLPGCALPTVRVGMVGGGRADIGVLVPVNVLQPEPRNPNATALDRDPEPVAELNGYGPIPPMVARALAAGGTWRRILTDPTGTQVLDVGRTRHDPPANIADHVRHRDRTCIRPGCSHTSRSAELDHIHEWQNGGVTSADNLGPQCTGDHRAKTIGAFTVAYATDRTYAWTTPTGHGYLRHPDGTTIPISRGTAQGLRELVKQTTRTGRPVDPALIDAALAAASAGTDTPEHWRLPKAAAAPVPQPDPGLKQTWPDEPPF